MLALVGTYRRFEYLPKLIASLDCLAAGITDIVFIDDSDDPATSDLLRKLGDVVETHGQGYNAAMKAAAEIGAQHDVTAWLEEDFYLTADVDFTALGRRLTADESLAQIVLQRQAWFPVEKRHGGVIEACIARGDTFTRDGDLLIHQAFFSGNPTVIRREVWEMGWPDGKWSEDQMRDRLLADGYRFAITHDIRCHHEGVRSGKGY